MEEGMRQSFSIFQSTYEDSQVFKKKIELFIHEKVVNMSDITFTIFDSSTGEIVLKQRTPKGINANYLQFFPQTQDLLVSYYNESSLHNLKTHETTHISFPQNKPQIIRILDLMRENLFLALDTNENLLLLRKIGNDFEKVQEKQKIQEGYWKMMLSTSKTKRYGEFILAGRMVQFGNISKSLDIKTRIILTQKNTQCANVIEFKQKNLFLLYLSTQYNISKIAVLPRKTMQISKQVSIDIYPKFDSRLTPSLNSLIDLSSTTKIVLPYYTVKYVVFLIIDTITLEQKVISFDYTGQVILTHWQEFIWKGQTYKLNYERALQNFKQEEKIVRKNKIMFHVFDFGLKHD